jgi:inositol-phosphate phosphatase / L-galactose 1-phosphate phosphatase / histidinol-phosphatase
MTVTPDDLQQFANRLADASGTIIRRRFRQKINVEIKDDNSPVSDADRETESELRRLIGATFPDHGVIGEEYGKDRPDAEFVWVLDPIDGTKSFITGRPLFGTLIALCHNGKPILGIIDHPALGERWIGATGQPTRFNGNPVRVRACSGLASAAMFGSSPHSKTPSNEAAFDRVRRAARQVLYSSDCYAYGLIACGFADLCIEFGIGIHDFLAVVPVIEGAGGIVTDWTGAALTTASGDKVIAAGDATVHRAAMELLAAN